MTKRFHLHVAALAFAGAAIGVGALAPSAQATVIYSGTLNLGMNADGSGNGLYLNMTTGATSNNEAAVPNWDFHFLSATNAVDAPFNSVVPPDNSYLGVLDFFDVAPVPVGTLINADTSFAYGGQPTSYLQGEQNVPVFAKGFASGAIMGVQFGTSSGPTLFGWIRFSMAPFADNGVLIDYAYDDSGAGIVAGSTVPAPSAGAGVLAVGGLSLLRRRRR